MNDGKYRKPLLRGVGAVMLENGPNHDFQYRKATYSVHMSGNTSRKK